MEGVIRKEKKMNNIQEIVDEVVRIVNYNQMAGNPVEKLIYIFPESATEGCLRFIVQYKRPPVSATEE